MTEDRPAADLIAETADRTRAAASARIELFIDHTWQMPPMPRRRRGGLIRPLAWVAKAAGKRLLKAASGNYDFRHQSAEGVIDLRARRYMFDYGSYARLYADGKEWDGRSGRPLSTLPPDDRELPTPLWLLDLLAGLTSAADERADHVRGTPCRCFTATVDIGRASKLAPGGVAVPALGRFEDLLALPIEVCIDDRHVRRVRYRAEERTETLELRRARPQSTNDDTYSEGALEHREAARALTRRAARVVRRSAARGVARPRSRHYCYVAILAVRDCSGRLGEKARK